MIKLSPKDAAKIAFSRILSRRIYKFRIKTFHRTITPDKLLRNFGYDIHNQKDFVAAFKQRLRERFFLSDLNKKEFYVNLMTSIGGFDSIMDDADMVHENKFKTLGSELYSFGEKIDWHLDFKSGKRWDSKFYSEIDVLDLKNQSDVKVPWELSRFHQALWLGKAYWISRSEAHAEKFKSLVEDWIENNPVGYGVNWVIPMEAAIRAMNLIVGSLYFIGSNRIDDDFFMKLLCSLYEHGIFIQYNLERSFRNGNHYISDLVGLIYLGIFFYDTKAGKRWVKFTHQELEREILNQVYEDGTDYEKSTSYQRLVAELFTAAYVLLKLNRFSISEGFRNRLESMFDFLASSTMPNGRAPNIGDADDGRVFRMKSEIDFSDHRDLLAVGATLFGRNDLKATAPNFSELALLLSGTEGFEQFSLLEAKSKVASRVFKDGGFAFLRTEKDFCSFDFGDIGMRGKGGHGHNDVLSFTIGGESALIVDRGTFCYTCNPRLRNKLRSTYSHNTAVVDGVEQAEFSGLWSIKQDITSPELLAWISNDKQDIVEAQHHAYERLPQPVTHKRKITFNKQQRTFIIEDNFLGEGRHKIELMFHFAPGLKATNLGRGFLTLEGKEFALIKFQPEGSPGLDFALEDWEHSSSYGVLLNAQTARITCIENFPAKAETFIFVLSNIDDINHILNRFK